MAMIAITTNNSIKVNALRRDMVCELPGECAAAYRSGVGAHGKRIDRPAGQRNRNAGEGITRTWEEV
jgi:hypothetical protein